jgi:hypothetical protein
MNTTKFMLPFMIMASVAVAPSSAQDIVVTGHPSFRDIEFKYDVDQREKIAKSILDASISMGTETTTARQLVREEGGLCAKAATDGRTRCTFSMFEAVEDHLHDVVWTIQLNSQEGRIVDLAVARESLGS